MMNRRGSGPPPIRPNQMLQQQQQILAMQQQQQQFLMRQRIIQEEQLQKQRVLRQQEDQRAGLNAAISELQKKTLEQQQQLRMPFSGSHPQNPQLQGAGPVPANLNSHGLMRPGMLPIRPPPGFVPPPQQQLAINRLPGPRDGRLPGPRGLALNSGLPQGRGNVIPGTRGPEHDRSPGAASRIPRRNMSDDRQPLLSNPAPLSREFTESGFRRSCSRDSMSGRDKRRDIDQKDRPREKDQRDKYSNIRAGESTDRRSLSGEGRRVRDSSRDSSQCRDGRESYERNIDRSRSESRNRGDFPDRRVRNDSFDREKSSSRSDISNIPRSASSSNLYYHDTGERDTGRNVPRSSSSSSLYNQDEHERDSRRGRDRRDERASRGDMERDRSRSSSRFSSRDSGIGRPSNLGDRDRASFSERAGSRSRYDSPRSGSTSRSHMSRSPGPRDRTRHGSSRPPDDDIKLQDTRQSFDSSREDRAGTSATFDDDDYFSFDPKLLTEEDESITYITRSCPADLYFSKDSSNGNIKATSRMADLETQFEDQVLTRAERVQATQVEIEEPPLHPPCHHHHACTGHGHKSSSSSESSSSEDDYDDEGSNQIMDEWEKRKNHPYSLHPELWFNIRGQANDGPLCRCSIKSRKSGIRHDIYPGEKPLEPCDLESNNLDRLHHYRVTLSPSTNLLTRVPTLIQHDNHEYIFEGFSLFSHEPLDNIPVCKLLRFNIEYTIHFIPEAPPENFTVRGLNLFCQFLFTEILELIDLDWHGPGKDEGSCQRFHFLPRFSRTLPDSGCKEVLSMNTVLSFILRSARPLVEESKLEQVMTYGDDKWREFVENVRGMIVTNPGMKPSSLRIDQLDRKVTIPTAEKEAADGNEGLTRNPPDGPRYPLIIHQGYRPAQLSYAGDPAYRKAWKQYVKFRHLLNSKPKILPEDKRRLKEHEEKLQEIRMKKTMKREVTIELSSKGFLCTGLRADVCQHALMMPVLMSHLRFHLCLNVLEDTIHYQFTDRTLLQLSLTHTSYRTNYGTNPDHTRNSLTNCGMRQVEYGDRRIHYQNTRKRGICILYDIMSRMGKQEETVSEVPHNERLEFLGDAVIEFLTSIHLFYMFPWLEEGGLTTYRMALVQNQHLALLSKKLKLQDFMLYVHGPDLCHESDLRHAMANCCEALMGALFLDGGIDVVDRIFSHALFDDENVLLQTWQDVPQHVLQQEEPGGDRHWVPNSPILQKLESFEESIGVKFTHIRLLAKAFTHRNIGVNPLTLGHNQRLEFLGDTVLQLVASEYLYKHYPEHHEGHLSLLRSSLVNSRTQGLVYDDLGMSEYVIFNENAILDGIDMKTKQRADILESFVGALFVDKGLDYCRTFCDVCFFPRLKDFILNQDWNDSKSQLQQCCLTLREVGGGEPDIPIYKVIESIGPTNTRKYVVAVYFRGKRLATGTGHSIQQAEMAAATNALKKQAELFPILRHQRRFLERMKKGVRLDREEEMEEPGAKKMRKNRPNQRRRKTQGLKKS